MTLLQLLETLSENDITVDVADAGGTIIKFSAPGYEALGTEITGRRVCTVSITSAKELRIVVVDENTTEPTEVVDDGDL